MDLQAYFNRIRYSGEVTPTLTVLNALHTAHVTAVPFENLDVQLGCYLTLSVDEAYQKIVVRGRGGWCFEQNGLFGWVLEQIGFHVTRVAALVMRDPNNHQTTPDHLCLLVSCPEDVQISYLVDVGFGGSLLRPLPLSDASCRQPPYTVGLEKVDDEYWRFSDKANKEGSSFDFVCNQANEHAMAEKCDFLQRDSSSSFVLNLVAQKRSLDKHTILRGRVLTRISEDSQQIEIIDTPDDLIRILFDEFALDLPQVSELWPKVTDRHEQLFG